jgi:hypothetical protein
MEDPNSKSPLACSQCGKPAVVNFGGHGLCVDHYLKLQQANYLQSSMLAANLNFIADQLDKGTGYLIRHSRVELPRVPFIGDTLTLNNINVSDSNIGAINTGTIQNLDASITVAKTQGQPDLAEAINKLAQAIIDNIEINDAMKNEIAEQLAFLMSQVTAKPEDRSKGMIRSILNGLKSSISMVASLLTIWDKVEPLLHAALGI